jgi:hypothetical protein
LGRGGIRVEPPVNWLTAAQDDFGTSVVEFGWPTNLNHASCEAADVAHIFEVGGEDHHREGAGHLIFAEVHVMYSFGADLHAHDLAGYTLGFSDVAAGFANGEIVGG